MVDGLNAPALESAWLDDTTLGWVYQYWNDPEREALDAKLNGGGKVEPHEIASKNADVYGALHGWSGCCKIAWGSSGWRYVRKMVGSRRR